jgi:sulfur carrier protein ThiS
MSVPGVTRQVDSVAAPIEKQYHDVMRQLRNTKAVGVVVAVNGQIIWADVFASTELLEKYWPKLVRSYAAEAVYGEYQKHLAGIDDAQSFLNKLSGEHEVVDSEPGVYRQAEITGSNFTAFELTSLLPKTGFDVHIAKMQTSVAEAKSLPVLHRYIPQ